MVRCCTLFANQCYWLQRGGVDPRVPRFVGWTNTTTLQILQTTNTNVDVRVQRGCTWQLDLHLVVRLEQWRIGGGPQGRA
jgi:hypothetical protein